MKVIDKSYGDSYENLTNDGIGSYECHGFKGYDHGSTFIEGFFEIETDAQTLDELELWLEDDNNIEQFIDLLHGFATESSFDITMDKSDISGYLHKKYNKYYIGVEYTSGCSNYYDNLECMKEDANEAKFERQKEDY